MNKGFDLSIVIISYNTKDLLRNCLNSIFNRLPGVSFEIIVVDNNSQDGTKEFLSGLTNQKDNIRCYFIKKNLGFGKANNFGMKKSKGKYLLLLNSDVVVTNDVIQKVIVWMENNSSYGVASPNLYNEDGSVQGTGGYFPTLPRVFSWMTVQDIPLVDLLIKPFHPMKSNLVINGVSFYKKEKDLDWVTGAFMMIRRKVYEDVGGFDEDFFMYTEEVEYCLRIKKKGWLIRYLPLPGIIHLGGASSSKGLTVQREFEGVKLLYKKHFSRWQYPFLRFFLKTGSFLRMLMYRIMQREEMANIYVKAFRSI